MNSPAVHIGPLLRGPCLARHAVARRHKSKNASHWAEIRRKETPPMLAMRHFDHFYPETYGPRWRSLRLALLSRAKPAAMVNQFGDMAATSARLEETGAYDMTAAIRALMEKQRQREKAADGRIPDSAEPDTPAETVASVVDEKADLAVADETSDAASSQEMAEAAGRLRLVQPDSADAAALYDYVPASELHGDEDWLEEADYFHPPGLSQGEDGSLTIALDPQPHLELPELLRVYSYPAGDISLFPRPKSVSSGPRDFYPLDAASLLPVLALDVQPGDNVLDMCAAPGGKSLALLQTLRPASLSCADTQGGRIRRLQQLFIDYLPASQDTWPCRVTVSKRDGRRTPQKDFYDRVLVDVPCFGDRHALVEEDNNIFTISRSRERIMIPQLQTQLLRSAIEAVRPGGTVVYSTCTLSPVQNDGVVFMALKQLWEDTDIQVVVKDLAPAVRPLYGSMWFARDCGIKYGQQVLPSVVNNFGPMYFAKIVRVK